jgi:hypothetical protein
LIYSPEADKLRAARMVAPADQYAAGRRYGRLEERKKILTLLGYLAKTSAKNRAGINEAIELIKGLSNV